jgi:hypothetical protein
MRPVLKFPGRRRDAFWFNGVEQALMQVMGKKRTRFAAGQCVL